MITFRHGPIPLLRALVASVLVAALAISAAGSESVATASSGTEEAMPGQDKNSASQAPARLDCLPVPVTGDHFADLREHSPFLRTLDLSGSLILTGVARIEEDTIATLLDLETHQSYVVSRNVSPQGWQLVEVKGDASDLETLTARIKLESAEVVSIRYAKAPKNTGGMAGAQVSTRIGDGTRGGGTGPHGGPDPRVLTPDQLADARNAARNIKAGFQADGYGDNQAVPPEVVRKASQLSVEQREKINVKMFEYRNRGLGMPERQRIYNGLLDRAVRGR